MQKHLKKSPPGKRERERERERDRDREINIMYTFVDQKDCHYVENAKTATIDHNYQDLNSTANTGMYCRFIVVPFDKICQTCLKA